MSSNEVGEHSDGTHRSGSITDDASDEDIASRALTNTLPYHAKTVLNSMESRRKSPSEDSVAEEDERDGRFYGPDSSWRFYTQDVRALAASLEQGENNDLSIHLYNAHALKARLRSPEAEQRIISYKNKRSWIPRSTETAPAFLPPDVWTAWPLEPVDVPRQREVWGVPTEHPHEQAGTFFKPEDWQPSSFLRDEIIAIFLRIAKQSVREQRWADTPSGLSPPSAHSSLKHDPDSAMGVASNNLDDGSVNDADAVSGVGIQLDDSVPSRLARKTIPSLSADEDENAQMLDATSRHVVTKVDDLLLGLHRSRRGHRLPHPELISAQHRARSKYQSPFDAQIHEKSPSKRKRLDSDPMPKIHRSRDRSRDDSRETSRSRLNSVPRSRDPLGVRDWTEILSVALMVGWDATVVERAARRCAMLFGERMCFQTLAETTPGSTPDSDQRYVPDLIPPLDELQHDREEEVLAMSRTLPSFPCPHVQCARHTKPYEKWWRLHEHLKRKHGRTAEQFSEMTPGQSPPGSNNAVQMSTGVLGEHPEDSEDIEDVNANDIADRMDFLCPNSDCVRHLQPYDTRWRLREHLKRKHGYQKDGIDELVPRSGK